MISREQAEALYRSRWDDGTAPDTPLEVVEFDLGYVLWIPPAPAEGGAPPTLGGVRAIVDRETGELTTWPLLPVEHLIAQHRTVARARTRFPQDVRAALEQSGWQPGRDASAAVNQWLAHTGVTRDLELFDLARTTLDEFGGLRIPQPGPGRTPGGGFRTGFYPPDTVADPFPTETLTNPIREFADELHRRVFPIGWNEDDPSYVAIDDHGWVYLMHWADTLVLGKSLVEALVWMVRGGDRPVVEDLLDL